MVSLSVCVWEGGAANLMVDIGATYSVLIIKLDLYYEKVLPSRGVQERQKYHWTEARVTNLGKIMVTPSFLVIPDCLYPLQG